MERCEIGYLKKFVYANKLDSSYPGTTVVYMDEHDMRTFFDTSGTFVYKNIYCLSSKGPLFLEELYAFTHKKDKYMVLKKDGTSCGQHPDKGLDMNLSETPTAVVGLTTGMYIWFQ